MAPRLPSRSPLSSRPPQPPPPLATVLPLNDPSPSYSAALRSTPRPSSPALSDADITRLRTLYPSCISVSSSLLSAASAPWNCSLVGKFLGRVLTPDKLLSSLTPKWSLEREWELVSLNYGFFLFRFSSAEDRDAVLSGGPWVVDDATLALELWDPSFIPSPSRLPRTVVWLRMPDLPPVCWHAPILELIASAAG